MFCKGLVLDRSYWAYFPSQKSAIIYIFLFCSFCSYWWFVVFDSNAESHTLFIISNDEFVSGQPSNLFINRKTCLIEVHIQISLTSYIGL